MSNLHLSTETLEIRISPPPENYMPQHPALHLAPAESGVLSTLKWAAKTSSLWFGDKGNTIAKLLLKHRELETERKNLEEYKKEHFWNKSKKKKISVSDNKIAENQKKIIKSFEAMKALKSPTTFGEAPVYAKFFDELKRDLQTEIDKKPESKRCDKQEYLDIFEKLTHHNI